MKKFFGATLAIILIIAVFFAARYLGAYHSFLDKITKETPEIKAYSVIVRQTSTASELKDLENTVLGFLNTDPHAKTAEIKLQNSLTFTSDFIEDPNTLLEMLNSNLFSSIVLETDHFYALTESIESSEENTRIIHNFTIELDKSPTTSSNKNPEKDPFLVYISGSDSRTGLHTTARSDVNILAAVHPETHKILLVSIPRDTYVQLHGTTGLKDKLTHAGLYGIEMSKTTIEDFLNIHIDYHIKVSFATVVKVVNELNGIEIYSDTAMTLKPENKNKTCHFVVGTQTVDGDCALRFARERKSYSTGDLHRNENQQLVLTGIINKLTGSKDYLLKLPAILDIAADSFETSFTKDEISSFIRFQFANNPNWQIESITIKGTSSMQPTYSMGKNLPLYVMYASEDSIKTAQTKINDYLNQPSTPVKPIVEE